MLTRVWGSLQSLDWTGMDWIEYHCAGVNLLVSAIDVKFTQDSTSCRPPVF